MQLKIEARMVHGSFISRFLHKINIERKVGFRIYLLHFTEQDLQRPEGKGTRGLQGPILRCPSSCTEENYMYIT